MEEKIFISNDGRVLVTQDPDAGAKGKPGIFEKKDIAFGLGMLLAGYLYIKWIITAPSAGAGVTLFSAVLIALTAGYLKASAYRQTGKSLGLLALTILCAARFVIFDSNWMSFWNFLLLSFSYVAWVSCTTGRLMDGGKLSVNNMGDVVNQLLLTPFGNFGRLGASIRSGSFGSKQGRNMLAAVVGLIVFLPLMVFVISLLMNADEGFSIFLNNIWTSVLSLKTVINTIVTFLFGLPVAFYIYGLAYGSVYGRATGAVTEEKLKSTAAQLKIAPAAMVNAVLIAFNVIYILFFCVKAAYMFSAFGSILPEGYTYAEYARQGFFELSAVAAINIGLVAVTTLINKERNPLTKGLTVVLGASTLLLVIIAMSKMLMYIDAYGLTLLRVYTSCFMVLIFFVQLVIIARQFKDFNAAKAIILSGVLSVLLLSFANVDGLVAKYNVDRYLEGTLVAVDVENMKYELSTAAVPAIERLYNEAKDPDVKARALDAITWGDAGTEGPANMSYDRNLDYRAFNIQAYKAGQIRAELTR